MGMGIEDNELVVARTIAHESTEVFPLAVRVKEFNVRSLNASEVEVSLERLKRAGVVTSYRHGWGLIIKHVYNGAEDKHSTFERTGDEPLYDGGNGMQDDEVYEIEFDASKLQEYLSSKNGYNTSSQRMIERRGEDFYFNDEKLPFDTKKSAHYAVLDIIYGTDGASRRMTYEEVNRLLEKAPYKLEKLEDRKALIQRIKNAIHNGLYRQMPKTIRKHLYVEPRVGLVFDNPSKG